MKKEITTVQLNKSVVRALKRIKKYPRAHSQFTMKYGLIPIYKK